MAEKKEYRSSVRSKKLIREAFRQLLMEKALEKITVTDIVKRADINRSTFYAHYPDVKGLVEEIEAEIIYKVEGVMSSFSNSDVFENPASIIESIHISLEEEALYKVLAASDYLGHFYSTFKNIFIEVLKSSPYISDEIKEQPKFNMRAIFFVGGILDVYQKWFMGEIDCTFNEILEDISKMMWGWSKDVINIEEILKSK